MCLFNKMVITRRKLYLLHFNFIYAYLIMRAPLVGSAGDNLLLIF